MTKKTDTWMPLLVDKYLGDTTDLTTEQHGAYLLLLMSMWKKDGVLPSDEMRLASIAKMAPAKWRANRVVLMEFFKPTTDGSGITQKRLTQELQRSKAHTDAKAEAGAKGAAKRWQRDGTTNGEADGRTDGTAIADGKQTPSQTGAYTPPPTPDASHQRDASSSELAPARLSAEPPQLFLVEPTAVKPKEPPDCPHLEVLALWAEVLPAMPQHKPSQWKGARADHLRTRWRETAVEEGWSDQDAGLTYLRRFFAYVGRSAFLTGRVKPRDNKPPFVIELEWLVLPSNWAKVVEGKYHQESA